MKSIYKNSQEYSTLLTPPFIIAEVIGFIIILAGIVLHGFLG